MGRFIAVGNCVLDIILRRRNMPSHSDLHLALGSFLQTISSVPRFPVEDDKIRASAVTKRRGGNTPNTIDVLE